MLFVKPQDEAVAPPRDPYYLDPFGPWRDTNAKRSSRGVAIHALDGIRGLAVLIVIASHTGVMGMAGQGALGVFLFFALSGFVLMLPFVDRPERILDRREIKAYFWNRFLRIMPAFIIALYFFYGQTHQSDLLWFPLNILFIRSWNHLWSIAEEVRFYLLFPLVVAGLAMLPPKWRLPGLLLLAVISWMAAKLLKVGVMDGTYPFYFYFFVGGMAAACICRARFPPWSKALLWIAPIGIVSAMVASSDTFVKMVWPHVSLNGWAQPETWCLLFAALLVSVVRAPRSPISIITGSWPLRHLGLLSYSMYLYHVCVVIALHGTQWSGWWLFGATLAGAYIAAVASYVFIEKPALVYKC